MKTSKIRTLLLIVMGMHALVLFFLVFALSYPNPLKAFQIHPKPDLPSFEGRANTTPFWFFSQKDCSAVFLIAHGRSRDKSYMSPLIESVWNQTNLCIMAIDLPSHGAREYGRTTIGLREKVGVDDALAWLSKNNHKRVVLYGVSMGGSAIIHSLKKEKPIEILGYITDGTYDDLSHLVRHLGEKLFLPKYLRNIGVFFVEHLVDYRITDVQPSKLTPNIPYPYLALQGSADPLVPSDSPRLLTTNQPNSIPIWYEGLHDEPQNLEMQSCVISFVRAVLESQSRWKEKLACSDQKNHPKTK